MVCFYFCLSKGCEFYAMTKYYKTMDRYLIYPHDFIGDNGLLALKGYFSCINFYSDLIEYF